MNYYGPKNHFRSKYQQDLMTQNVKRKDKGERRQTLVWVSKEKVMP